MQQYILVYLLIPFLYELITNLDAKKCYVCGPKSYDPFKNIKVADKINHNNNKHIVTDVVATEKLINVEEDNLNESSLYNRNCGILEKYIDNQDLELMNEFVKVCPPSYKGCIIQKDVNQTMRTCDMDAFNDCRQANGVTYCYCSNDLCNDKITIATEPDKPKINYQNDRTNNRYSDENSDDEDISEEESSGMDDKFKSFSTSKTNMGISNGINNNSSKLFSIINTTFQINFIIVLICLKIFIKIF